MFAMFKMSWKQESYTTPFPGIDSFSLSNLEYMCFLNTRETHFETLTVEKVLTIYSFLISIHVWTINTNNPAHD